jgi:tetratricopeptide (TPR) repeat protein
MYSGLELDYGLLIVFANIRMGAFGKGVKLVSEEPREKKIAYELMRRALAAKFNGEFDKALNLMDQAITISEKAGLDPYQCNIQKELLLIDASPNKDLSGLISPSLNALELYERQQNIVKQIDTLINIAGLFAQMGKDQQALNYIDKVETLLSSSTPEMISQYLPKGLLLSGKMFINLRKNEVKRIRFFIEN